MDVTEDFCPAPGHGGVLGEFKSPLPVVGEELFDLCSTQLRGRAELRSEVSPQEFVGEI
ncbi:hypothetical protein [Streptomyces sp. KLOTTS4A1]|uniref:hypothetical protein n=1 Tax=Streptomyces sp. KLOTTS4A1 TaxID=3390996 RepID=UPI0039F49F4C